MKEDLEQRIHRCGVSLETLQQGVLCGAYPSLEAALDRIDLEWPLGKSPKHVVKLSRMKLVNEDIDTALFNEAMSTSAWTYLDDFGVVFVLIGPEERGVILHERMRRSVPFRLTYHWFHGVRFMKFKGDDGEKVDKNGKPIISKFRLLSGKMHMKTWEAREMFEMLIRACDDSAWHHEKFPFISTSEVLDAPQKMLRRFNLLIHKPASRSILKENL